MRNLTGAPYHIENQRYMYVQEHGNEVSRLPKQEQIKRAAKMENRAKVKNIIELVNKNCKQMPMGKKYYRR